MQTSPSPALAVFNVREYGATGHKDDNAQPALQRAIDACGAAGGGLVYVPPGAYTTGTLHLRSHIRLYVEAGATLYSSKDPTHWPQRALFFADGVSHLTLDGRGTIDGQAEYRQGYSEWIDYNIYPNQLLAEKAGVPLRRAYPTDTSIGHLVLFLHCQDVRIERLNFLHSPSWTMHLYDCQRVAIDGVYIYTTQKDGVWADGIDPDGCQDVHISNCTIETGDDAIVFYSYTIYGPARPCENITITNCRLSSSSSAIKFCDCNFNAIRNVTINNCVITNSNRGIAFMVFDGGVVENVVISNCTIECKRFDWFWWGDGDPLHFNLIKRSELHLNTDKDKEPPVGAIRNVTLSNIIGHGPGPSVIHGSVDSPLENVTFENVRLTIDTDPDSPLQKGPAALTIENARNFKLKDVEFHWAAPIANHWEGALVVNNVKGLTLDGVSARQALDGSTAPAITLNDVDDVIVRDCEAQAGTGTFLALSGAKTRNIVLRDNDLRKAKAGVMKGEEVSAAGRAPLDGEAAVQQI